MSKVMCHKCERIHGGNFSLCDWCMNAKIIDIEAQLKAKDEEIIRLFNDREEERKIKAYIIECGKEMIKLERKKARSIVAMLFWEWKKQCENRRKYNDHHNFAREQKRSEAYYCFQKAYKMLKDD